MEPRLEETITLDFCTHRFDTGAAADADSLPTCEVYKDATDTTLAGVTVTKRVGKTGVYRVQIVCTTANGFEVGKAYNAVAAAVVNLITGKGTIGSWMLRPAQETVIAGTVSDKSGYSLAVPAPSAADNAAATRALLDSVHGTGLWTSSAAGTGASHETITVLDALSNPVADCEVWITSDVDGGTVVAGPLVTGDDGTAEFLLDVGVTYYLWRRKAGVNFTNPATIVSVGD